MTAPTQPTRDDLGDVRVAMNNMYRWTRHVYDASRKYYLLGRDRLIAELCPASGAVVLEAGCGTARNLIKIARAYPGVRCYGFDASEEMLKTARDNVARAGLGDRITLAHGFAQNFDPQAVFGLLPGTIDKIVFSYALSMIPPWRESLDHALTLVRPGGDIHIVDFGDQAALPRWFRAVLYTWLDLFGVHFRPELPVYIRKLGFGDRLVAGLRGYYFLAVLRRS